MTLESLPVWLIGLVLVTVTMTPFVLHQRRKERRTTEAEARARKEGLHIPASLHPVVNTDLCIGTGSCIAACPEHDILGIRGGQAVEVAPANCIGHGLCERSCPVEAIQLVFGTAKRGVDIPRVRENYETNVPGLFIVGELGGMGLIRNAFEQGSQCVKGIAGNGGKGVRNGRNGSSGALGGKEWLDLAVVGCGPAGLSAALTAKTLGLRTVVLEREDIGGTVRHYPRKKLVMTESLEVPGFGKIGAREILKEDLIEIWEEVVQRAGLEVTTGATVTEVQPLDGGGFRVVAGGETFSTRNVVLAIGRRGVPRKLGIPGEHLPNVAYSLREPEAYRGDRITVVGGGDSAVEAGLALAGQPGNEVRIAYRKGAFSRAKPKNRERVEEAVSMGRLSILWNTEIVENREEEVVARGPEYHENVLPNDHLFVFAGGQLPTPFLERCGIQIDTKFGER